MKCNFNEKCQGYMVCGACSLSLLRSFDKDTPLNLSTECECDASFYSCNICEHKMCNWCSGSTLSKSDGDCEECNEWNYVNDVCELEFCVQYLDGQGYIKSNLKCNMCYSTQPIIRVPLAFPLELNQLLQEYPKFESIKSKFLKYYSYSHTNGIWEPYAPMEFRLAQEYFDFDGGVIVLGRSKDEERNAKAKEEKKINKQLKKDRRAAILKERESSKLNQILSI